MPINELDPSALLAPSLAGNTAAFTLTIGGGALRVVEFSGREAISSPFEFTVRVACENEDVEALIGQSAHLQLESGASPRSVHGVVRAAEYVGNTRSLDLYELSIVPWAHYLSHRTDVRLFQDKTTVQIVSEVLTDAGLPRSWFRFALIEQYAPRNYCVQYRETDLTFVSRLLEEDGIFYFFEHHKDRHVWVMADHASAHPPIPGEEVTWYRPPAGSMVQSREHVHTFRFGGRVRAGKVTLRDFNLHKPDENLEAVESDAAEAGVQLESYDYPGEYQTAGKGGSHQGGGLAKIRLEALRATQRAGGGDGDCPRFTAGFVMELTGHPRMALNGKYRITAVEHRGAQPQVLGHDAGGATTYGNKFTCTALELPFRPPRVTPRPVVGGLQTATVVGPAGEEIYTDEHGRVRVQFHWDRDGGHDESSTCWLRVSQAWAGNGWGAVFLPRIGHEVLVDFIEGDPDRPIVTGRIYHGYHPPPYALPDNKTQSGIKTESTPGGGGSNELRFEDQKGGEEVYIHAQKDLTEAVENDHSTTVGNNHSNAVGVDESISIGANQTISVGSNQTESIGANQTLSVGANQTESVGANQTSSVGANRSVSVGGSQSVSVGDGATLSVTNDYKVDATGKIDVQAPTHIKLTCGGSSITIEPGKITISAGDGASLTLDVDALLKSAAGSELKLDPDALLKASTGAQIKLDANLVAEARPGSKLTLDADATMSSPGVGSVQAPTAALAGGGGMVEAGPGGVTCAGGQVNLSGGMVNVAGGLVKIN